ncbi:aromatic ring-hydroxylating dioxygenase subunit alpha [Aquidulcibacter sp.]|jgi:choline monooxygenase|uniref:aromatic ring-hydroxylating dioxygenase subunit alpha n=1 Tax=Aquidulcibacter sp. TaxID=2052990 RepID=UPI0037C09208
MPLLSAQEVSDIFAPIASARTLPPRAFTDQAFFEAEVKAIFMDGWAALCLKDIAPRAGDAVPLQFVGVPLLVVHGQDEVLRVFHNLCPYDQCPVLIDPVSAIEVLESAYHGWRYALDGELIGTPYWDGVADEAKVSAPGPRQLKPVRSAIWGPALFINLSGAAQHFDDYIAPMNDLFGDIDMDILAIGHNHKGEPMIDRSSWGGNWKTHHENACVNVYHENFVHFSYRQSSHVPRVDAQGQKLYTPVCDRGVRGLRFTNEAAGDTYIDLGIPALETKNSGPVKESIIISLFPNIYCSLIGAHLHVTIVTPDSVDTVQVMTASYYEKGVAKSAELAPLRTMVEQAWIMAAAEDSRVINAIQSGRRSPVAAPGFYAPFWDAAHHDFTQQVTRSLIPEAGTKL